MAERKKIALNYTYNENWIGGTYYTENLVAALYTLNDVQKPHLVVIVNSRADLQAAKRSLRYPYISYQIGSGERNHVFQFVNKVTFRLAHFRLFDQVIRNLAASFPYYPCRQQSLAEKKIYWIADFQEHFVPWFFDEATIAARKRSQEQIQASSDMLILSSSNALSHFKTLYPKATVRTHVVPFAVTHPPFRHLHCPGLLHKYDLPPDYLICPNQFWQHKNQVIILRALVILKERGVCPTMVFTGKTLDLRNPDYFDDLTEIVRRKGLMEQVRFLGFIDRAEQLQLMDRSLAIIQPSLFEGWSTVVEDAKSMNKGIIVSDIAVHREQLAGSAARWFDPENANELAENIQEVIRQNGLPALYPSLNYQRQVEDFGRRFLHIALE